MPAKSVQLLAVGAAVAAELVLGALLVVHGGGTPANPNPYRVGEGFPVPPPCSMIDQALVGKLIGDHQLAESTRLDDDDPVRTCAYTATLPERGTVNVDMFSRLVQGELEIHALGISDLMPYDNFATFEYKRYYNYAGVTFEIDNLDVRVDHRFSARNGIPTPPDAARVRADVLNLTKHIAGKLTPRNKTGPTLPSIPPSTRR